MATRNVPIAVNVTAQASRLRDHLLSAWPAHTHNDAKQRATKTIARHIRTMLPADYKGSIAVEVRNQFSNADFAQQGFLYHLEVQRLIEQLPEHANDGQLLHIQYDTTDEINTGVEAALTSPLARLEQLKQWHKETIKAVIQAMADTALTLEAQTTLRGALGSLNRLGNTLAKATQLIKKIRQENKAETPKRMAREIKASLSGVESRLNILATNSSLSTNSQLALKKQIQKLQHIKPAQKRLPASIAKAKIASQLAKRIAVPIALLKKISGKKAAIMRKTSATPIRLTARKVIIERAITRFVTLIRRLPVPTLAVTQPTKTRIVAQPNKKTVRISERPRQTPRMTARTITIRILPRLAQKLTLRTSHTLRHGYATVQLSARRFLLPTQPPQRITRAQNLTFTKHPAAPIKQRVQQAHGTSQAQQQQAALPKVYNLQTQHARGPQRYAGLEPATIVPPVALAPQQHQAPLHATPIASHQSNDTTAIQANTAPNGSSIISAVSFDPVPLIEQRTAIDTPQIQSKPDNVLPFRRPEKIQETVSAPVRERLAVNGQPQQWAQTKSLQTQPPQQEPVIHTSDKRVTSWARPAEAPVINDRHLLTKTQPSKGIEARNAGHKPVNPRSEILTRPEKPIPFLPRDLLPPSRVEPNRVEFAEFRRTYNLDKAAPLFGDLDKLINGDEKKPSKKRILKVGICGPG